MAHLTVILQAGPPEIGWVAETDDWPLHVTLMQAFRVRARSEQVVRTVEDSLRDLEPLAVTGAASERFGPNADIEVTVLEPSAGLAGAHGRLLAELSSLAEFRPDVPAYSGEGYRAHVTACSTGSLPVGSEMRLSWAAVVDMDGGPVVLSAIALRKRQ